MSAWGVGAAVGIRKASGMHLPARRIQRGRVYALRCVQVKGRESDMRTPEHRALSNQLHGSSSGAAATRAFEGSHGLRMGPEFPPWVFLIIAGARLVAEAATLLGKRCSHHGNQGGHHSQ